MKRFWINFFGFWGIVVFFSFGFTTIGELGERRMTFWEGFLSVCIIATIIFSVLLAINFSKKQDDRHK